MDSLMLMRPSLKNILVIENVLKDVQGKTIQVRVPGMGQVTIQSNIRIIMANAWSSNLNQIYLVHPSGSLPFSVGYVHFKLWIGYNEM
jgi:hypothetical protein